MQSWYARTVFFVKDGAWALEFYESIGFKEQWTFTESGRIVVAGVSQ